MAEILQNGKAGNALKPVNSEKIWAVSQLARKTTQVSPVAQEGKLGAKAGRNTQINSTSDH